MRRQTSDIRTKFTVEGAMAVALEFEAYRRHFDDSMEQRAGVIIDQLLQAGFQIVQKPETGRVVVLDEAGERKLQDLLSGKSVPTGRIVEVTYRLPDGSTHTQRHAEFGSLDKVSYDPPPVVGSEIAGATVLKATETDGQAAPAKTNQMPDLALYSVRVGWPEFRALTTQGRDGLTVATVTSEAKREAESRHPERADRTRWVAFSWQQKRFLAPDEPAPYHFAVGPYEAGARVPYA